MRNTTTTVVIAAGLVLAAVVVTRTPGQQQAAGVNGACCLPTGGCLAQTPEACAVLGGAYLGDATTCAGSTCPSVASPTVVATSVTISTSVSGTDRRYRIFRTWSDGQVDMSWMEFQSSTDAGACVVASNPAPCGPVVLIPGTCTTDINRDGDTGIQDFLALLGGWGACQ